MNTNMNKRGFKILNDISTKFLLLRMSNWLFMGVFLRENINTKPWKHQHKNEFSYDHFWINQGKILQDISTEFWRNFVTEKTLMYFAS